MLMLPGKTRISIHGEFLGRDDPCVHQVVYPVILQDIHFSCEFVQHKTVGTIKDNHVSCRVERSRTLESHGHICYLGQHTSCCVFTGQEWEELLSQVRQLITVGNLVLHPSLAGRTLSDLIEFADIWRNDCDGGSTVHHASKSLPASVELGFLDRFDLLSLDSQFVDDVEKLSSPSSCVGVSAWMSLISRDINGALYTGCMLLISGLD